MHGASTTEAARPLLWSIRRCAFFLPRCDDDVCPSAKSAVTKSVLIATNPPLWRASSGGRLLPLAAPNMMNKLQEARCARALRQDGCAKG